MIFILTLYYLLLWCFGFNIDLHSNAFDPSQRSKTWSEGRPWGPNSLTWKYSHLTWKTWWSPSTSNVSPSHLNRATDLFSEALSYYLLSMPRDRHCKIKLSLKVKAKLWPHYSVRKNRRMVTPPPRLNTEARLRCFTAPYESPHAFGLLQALMYRSA